MFITFEGGEGAGKSTQLKKLAETLTNQGHQILATREPGGAPNAELLRKILLAPENEWSPDAETLLHFAARAEHIAKTIQPALQAGKLVLCDRFYDSTRAYQAAGQGADAQLIETLINLLPLKPDLTLILDVTPATARARLIQRDTTADRYERLPPTFHARVAEAFRNIATTTPTRCRLIDANPDPETVAAAILAAVQAHLQTKNPR